ncbi:hypothetical protein HBA54_02450 [Pelagibius litoralis]|uniref:HPt domain-containing protein n=1 Tax=Pelagibius litoralis TaxID=374515 RepID=A0A967EWM5_9PROT|nr:Hpt domain-containing protein [Pelagibius litoralis]NIA67443.1 hypothetical protein [Pelagibius litoralis]
MGLDNDKSAAMRAAFQADLARRLSEIEAVIDQLQTGRASFEEASAAFSAQLHDIKGTGRPFGVPQATDLAADFERTIKTETWREENAPGLVRQLVSRLRALC